MIETVARGDGRRGQCRLVGVLLQVGKAVGDGLGACSYAKSTPRRRPQGYRGHDWVKRIHAERRWRDNLVLTVVSVDLAAASGAYLCSAAGCLFLQMVPKLATGQGKARWQAINFRRTHGKRRRAMSQWSLGSTSVSQVVRVPALGLDQQPKSAIGPIHVAATKTR